MTLIWGGLALPAQLLSDTDAPQAFVSSVTVHHATVVAAGDGPVEVLYQVHRGGRLQHTSPLTQVQVQTALPGPQDPQPETPFNELLVAPVVKGKSRHLSRQDKWLDEDDYLLNADAVIAWHPVFRACDEIQLFWGSWPIPLLREINANDVQAAEDLVICLPNRLITGEGVCRAINVHYTLSRAGNPNISRSMPQSVRVVCRAHLPGGEAGLPAAVLVEVDAGNTLRLPAREGGTSLLIPPYRNMRLGDRMRLNFAGFDTWMAGDPIPDSNFEVSIEVNTEQLLQGCSVLIPEIHLTGFNVGRAEVYYQIENDYGTAYSLKADAYVDMRPAAIYCTPLPNNR